MLAVLLCAGGLDALQELPVTVRSLLDESGADVQRVSVPRFAPLVRWQFEAWNQVWPCHFHESAATHSLATWTRPLVPDQLPEMRNFMRQAIELARAHGANGGRRVAALIVRRQPESEAAVIASSVDSTVATACTGATQWHPLGHALMRCIEQVAALERAQAHYVSHAARRKRKPAAGDERSAAHTAAGEGAEEEGSEPPPTCAESSTDKLASPCVPHLCVDCDVYVTLEPCAMCAMALVHSRVRRVFYALPAPEGGALGSRYRLHTERSINHHFQVVEGMLRGEAEDAGLGIEPRGHEAVGG